MGKFVSMAATAAIVAGLSLGAESSQAVTLTFFNISNNSGQAAAVATQLTVEVEQGADDTQASFTFLNNVGIAASITDVYFDDGSLLGIASISSSAGVSFSPDANPANLPGGNCCSFDASFSADSDEPPPANGVNSSTDWLTIIFNLVAGMTFEDTIAALISGDLRLGMHVQAIGTSGQSDGFINNPLDPVPLPAGLLLFLSGLAGIGFLGRFKATRSEPATA